MGISRARTKRVDRGGGTLKESLCSLAPNGGSPHFIYDRTDKELPEATISEVASIYRI